MTIRCYPEVIHHFLKPYTKGDCKVYYYDNWLRFLDERDITRYVDVYGVNPNDFTKGIKVYFDNKGDLRIKNCQDQIIQEKIEKNMANWYEWAKKEFKNHNKQNKRIIEVIAPYMRYNEKTKNSHLKYEDEETVLDET